MGKEIIMYLIMLLTGLGALYTLLLVITYTITNKRSQQADCPCSVCETLND